MTLNLSLSSGSLPTTDEPARTHVADTVAGRVISDVSTVYLTVVVAPVGTSTVPNGE
ncbi:hypothetical protein [Citrobacter braakii]|uniref:hypothetical protein n=1 Tax=Citrobacter braakii TaxID=57706 RepID=UPI002B25219D|nr:hypothetical protein [Citrobacter braakii]MEB2307288.1 hypothetical protein [Citrobacter braakii]